MTSLPFPTDLPDLLRIACGQGKLRLNVSHSAERGHQANLANSGEGWTIDYDRDPLEAITKVLRVRYGKMLERQRAGDAPATDAVHSSHAEPMRPVKGQFTSRQDAGLPPVQIDIEEAIAAASDPDGMIG